MSLTAPFVTRKKNIQMQTPFKAQQAECCALAGIYIPAHTLTAKPINATHGHRFKHLGLMLYTHVPKILFGRHICLI